MGAEQAAAEKTAVDIGVSAPELSNLIVQRVVATCDNVEIESQSRADSRRSKPSVNRISRWRTVVALLPRTYETNVTGGTNGFRGVR